MELLSMMPVWLIWVVFALLAFSVVAMTVLYLREKTLEEIRADVYQLFLNAEHIYKESAQGQQKMKWVIQQARGLLPEWAKAIISEEMLMMAREKSEGKDILYLNQDMTEFELYGTMRAIVCSMDGFNYILDEDELLKTFKLCNNYLDPDGRLIFDINSFYKFTNILADNTFVYDNEDVFYKKEKLKL